MFLSSFGKIDQEIVLNVTPLWNLDRSELPENVFSFDIPLNSRYSNLYFFNSSCFNFFDQGVNLDSFIPEVDCLFLNMFK